MTLQNIPGTPRVQIGIHPFSRRTLPGVASAVLDAANEAMIYVGQIITADGGSHTIDTTGSSSLGWMSGTITFVNAGTTVKVGLAAVDTAVGPPARAANATDVITFDVSKSLTGGGGGIPATAWQTHVPDAGSKTIANGDLVAFAIQMTARAGSDIIRVSNAISAADQQRPALTTFVGGAYASLNALPNCIIVFSDGVLGYFYASEVLTTVTTRTFNSGSSPNEYGQLYNLPFPCKIYGLYGFIDPDADSDIVLYSDPLGTPVAEKTVSLDANTVSSAAGLMFAVLFTSPYSYAANTNIAAIYKPGASNISVYAKTLASATYRITDAWGTSGYGVSRASGAFANANTSLDHYYIGLLVGAFDDGASSAGGAHFSAAYG